MSAIKYRPEVDGLRALAVLPVVLFHLGLPGLSGGFIGVDVFFVISGFLITSIILKEQAAGTFTFTSFWMRRVRRILPAMLTMLIVTSIAGYFLLFAPRWRELGDQVISAILLYANIEMWQLSGSYWGPAAENAPLLHTWSLSVEEQFYLFYPLILLILLKFTPKRVFPLILAGCIFSFIVGVLATTYRSSAAFYLLPPRAWELAAGCLLAIFERSRGPAPRGNISRTLAFVGLLLVVAGYALITGAEGFPGYLALLPVVGTVLIIRFANCEKCLTGSVLSWAPVVYIGKCSYSLYLWHWPVIVLAGAFELKYHQHVGLTSIIVLMTILSLASYHFVEKPTRRTKHILMPVVVATAISLGLAFYLRSADCVYDTSGFEPTESYGRQYMVTPVPLESVHGRLAGYTLHSGDGPSYDYTEGVVCDFGQSEPKVMVLGSSHGVMWGHTIAIACEELGLTVAMFNSNGVDPRIQFPLKKKAVNTYTADQKYAFDVSRLEHLKQWKPQVVIIAHRWTSGGILDPFEYMEFFRYLESCESQVILLEQPPELPIEDVNAPNFLVFQYPELMEQDSPTLTLPLENDDQLTRANARIREFADSLDFCHYLPVGDFFKVSEHEVLAVDHGQVLYLDDDHLSQAGTLKAKDRIKEFISTLAKP